MKIKFLSPLRKGSIKAGMTMIAVMALSTMLGVLTTACSSEDDAIANEITNPLNENTAKKVYTLPVTLNVTRQGDNATTRATYDDETKKLSFSEGDKLLVYGEDSKSSKDFAGLLTWQSGNTFSGTLSIPHEYSGTAQEYLAANDPDDVHAILLPKGYETYNFFDYIYFDFRYIAYISERNLSQNIQYQNAFALTKALAVEQFSFEKADSYSNGFALSPRSAILNFTITNLTPNTEFEVWVCDGSKTAFGTVTTDGSGNATFAIGVSGGTNLKDLLLGVGNVNGRLSTNNKTLEAGHIYNITRDITNMPQLFSDVTESDIGKVVGLNGIVYKNAAAATAAGTEAVAMIVYVGSTDVPSPYNHGVALALTDESGEMTRSSARSACESKNTSMPVPGALWMLPDDDQWEKISVEFGKNSSLWSALNLYPSEKYWSSMIWQIYSDWDRNLLVNYPYFYWFHNGSIECEAVGYEDYDYFEYYRDNVKLLVRACLAF